VRKERGRQIRSRRIGDLGDLQFHGRRALAAGAKRKTRETLLAGRTARESMFGHGRLRTGARSQRRLRQRGKFCSRRAPAPTVVVVHSARKLEGRYRSGWGERKFEAVNSNAEARSGGGRRGVFAEVRIPVRGPDDRSPGDSSRPWGQEEAEKSKQDYRDSVH
jgi:hypothetical protein